MKIWIDTEFNEYQGDLISIGMVDENNYGFYACLECSNPNPWVKEHVMPKAYTREIESINAVSIRMQQYLMAYSFVHLIADWPDDILHFCRLLVTGPGIRINSPPLKMEIDRSIDSSESENPHHALWDAIAIKKSWQKQYGYHAK